MFLPVFVCLSVCLSVCLTVRKITQKRVMDLDEMLRVDRCRDMGELINFWALIRIMVRMPEPDCFLWYRISAATYWPPVAAATRGFNMDLFTASRRNTFVGGTCALPSALLVLSFISFSRIELLSSDSASIASVDMTVCLFCLWCTK